MKQGIMVENSILDACHCLINFKTRLLTYLFERIKHTATGLCNYNLGLGIFLFIQKIRYQGPFLDQ